MTDSKNTVRRPVALVTGAARGLGRATAIELAGKGYFVWLGVRSEADGAPLLAEILRAGGNAELLALDVTDRHAVHAAAKQIAERHGVLELLVNNAGVMLDGGWMGNTSISVDAVTLQRTFDTNFFGVVALTQALWPLLISAGGANVVNVSSMMGSNTIHADPDGPLKGAKPFAYDASKAALNAFTTHLAELGQPVNIQVNSAHPGWVKTELGTDDAPLSIAEGVRTIVELALLAPGSRSGRFEHAGTSVPW